jgi:DNA-binding MarR family transcriptional regulator
MNINEAIKQKKFENEWEKALINLHFTSNEFNDRLITILKPYSINDQHYNILRILNGRYPNVACPGDIKAVLLNKRGDLTRLLDKLSKLNYVERATNPSNRRMVDIKITPAGIALLKKLRSEINTINTLKKNLTEKEAIQLSLLLDKIRL